MRARRGAAGGKRGRRRPPSPDYKVPTKTAELKALAGKAQSLRGVLSQIPEQIEDRTKFLANIRSIASTIKELLEATAAVSANNGKQLGSNGPALEQQKKAFVRVSKSFSETLKRYFKDGKKDAVLRAAHRLVNQTNLLCRTVKHCVK